jgi:hypothetical protein
MELHQEIGHFGKNKTFANVCKIFYLHNYIKQMHLVVRTCKKCHLVKCTGSIWYDVEDLKNILVCDLFYKISP